MALEGQLLAMTCLPAMELSILAPPSLSDFSVGVFAPDLASCCNQPIAVEKINENEERRI